MEPVFTYSLDVEDKVVTRLEFKGTAEEFGRFTTDRVANRSFTDLRLLEEHRGIEIVPGTIRVSVERHDDDATSSTTPQSKE